MSRPAFTLLELLLASAISVMLMTGVLAVIARLAPASAASLAGIPQLSSDDVVALSPGAVDSWVELLREDLGHAYLIDHAADQIVLEGHAAVDAIRRQRSHRPVRVVYSIATVDGRPWLVRRQEALDVRTNLHVQRDLVCMGVSRFELSSTALADGRTLWRLRAWVQGRSEPAFERVVGIQWRARS